MTATASLVQVHLLGLPVPLAAQARQHFEELLREFALITGGADTEVSDDQHLPVRLQQLVSSLRSQYGGANSAADERLEDAIDAGLETIDDHVLELPSEAGPAARSLDDLIDEADEYCRRGDHLLTLATPPECVAYRRWYLGQVVDQLDGKAPVAWSGPGSVRGCS